MKNKNFMISKTVVKKYVGIYEKSLSGVFGFYQQISGIKTKLILDKKCGKFS
jgi:hypothetical protein